MNLRFLFVVELVLVVAGGFTMEAYGASCREAHRIRTVYWNDLNTGHPAAAADMKRQNEWAFRGNCGANDWRGYGDWDHDRHWHDSGWWVNHDRGWAQQHHPDWVRGPEPEHHEGHDADGDEHHGHGHDHDKQ